MAFDYGSIDLGLKNPFKKEGAAGAVRGIIVAVLGIYLLITAAGVVKSNAIEGWILVVFGVGLLANGIVVASGGIVAMLRYFVGRNHPTSLAYNYSRSESSTAKEEQSYVAYTKQGLSEMLVGRKNATFIEPQGFLARFVHSVFPRLTYMPYPVRNMAQRLFGAWVKTLVAIVAYGFVAFVSLAGFIGEMGEFVFPVYSVALTLYLLFVWRSAGRNINRMAEKTIPSMGGMELVRTITGAILLPVIIGLVLQFVLSSAQLSLEQVNTVLSYLPQAHTALYLAGVFIGAILSSALVFIMLRKRINYADPKVEVSELRENWQESVHPNEVFINLDNLVMANRRYKEVPNRVYQELEPTLNEQVEGKGNFFGEMIQEIQPKFKPMDLGSVFENSRMGSLLAGNALSLVAAVLTVFLALSVAEAANYLQALDTDALENNAVAPSLIEPLSDHVGSIIHLFLAAILLRAFGRILMSSAHLFFAEMQFESNLIYLKAEGTFTESKISTGASIHDSTRSENTLVRSSITPWVIVCRVVSSTFAATGMRNLEHPRFILEMHKNDAELQGIRTDIVSFLKDRESIAVITSERDLHNTSQIHEINQQSRAMPMQSAEALTKMDEEAGGYLRQEAERDAADNEKKDS